MKALTLFSSLVVFGSCTVYQGTVYNDPIYDVAPARTIVQSNNGASNNDGYYEGADDQGNSSTYYDPNYSSFDDGLSYSARFNRFYRPSMNFGYYSPYYSSFGFGYPYSGFSMSFGTGWGFGNYGFYDPWYNPWYNPYYYGGFGYVNPYYGYNRFYSPYYSPYFYGSNREFGRNVQQGRRGGLNHGYGSGSTPGGTRPDRGGMRPADRGTINEGRNGNENQGGGIRPNRDIRPGVEGNTPRFNTDDAPGTPNNRSNARPSIKDGPGSVGPREDNGQARPNRPNIDTSRPRFNAPGQSPAPARQRPNYDDNRRNSQPDRPAPKKEYSPSNNSRPSYSPPSRGSGGGSSGGGAVRRPR